MKTFWFLFPLLLLPTVFSAQPSKWTNSGISGGSALFYPSFSPYDTDIIYMASDLTGMFFTVDGGKSWDVVPFTELRATTLSKIHFTGHPDTLFTIHNDFRNVAQYVYRSDDGGTSWHTLTEDPTGGETVYLYVDPDHTQRLIVTDYQSIYYSADGGHSFHKAYDATDNIYLGGVFWHGEQVYLGSNEGLLMSENSGRRFQKVSVENLDPDLGILSLKGSEFEQGIQLFCTVRDKNFMWSGMLSDGGDYYGEQKLICIEKTEGNQFASQNINSNLRAFEDFPFYVDIPRVDQNRVLFSAGAYLNQTGNHIHPQVYRLSSESLNWETTLKTDNNANIATGYMGHDGDFAWSWSENAMGFGFNPSNPQIAIVTDFSFAHITRDGGNSWEALYVRPEDLNPVGQATPRKKSYRTNGLENTSVWWLAWNSPDDVFAGYTDITAIRSEDGGNSWSFDYEGLDGNIGEKYNTIYQVSSGANGVWYAASSTLHDLYQSTELGDDPLDNEEHGGAVFRSVDGGINWTLVEDFQRPVVWTALDPNNNNVLYASVVNSQTGGIYKTENLGNGPEAIWEKLTAPPNTEGHPYNIHVLGGDTLVCTYSGRLTQEVQFTPSSGVFYSENGGYSWEDRSLPDMKYWTKDLVIDPHDQQKNTWYVGVFDGFSGHPATVGTGGLYRTKDRGKSWEELGDFYRVESVTIHPENPDIMYVTTEQDGLWYTDDLRSTQPTFRLLEAYPFQHPVRVFINPFNANEVWVASFGNGLRKGTAPVTTKTKKTQSERPEMDVYPNPADDQIQITINNIRPPVSMRMYNYLGRLVHYNPEMSLIGHVEVNGFLPGLYLVEVSTKTHRLVKKIMIK